MKLGSEEEQKIGVRIYPRFLTSALPIFARLMLEAYVKRIAGLDLGHEIRP